MSIEIFHSEEKEQTKETCFWNSDDDTPRGSGWYYWFCFPGCLPESDPLGPFATEDDARRDSIETGYCDFPGHSFSIERAPACWASYFINGDSSGLEEKEEKQADEWLEWLGPKSRVIDIIGEEHFGTFHGIGHSLIDYIIETED